MKFKSWLTIGITSFGVVSLLVVGCAGGEQPSGAAVQPAESPAPSPVSAAPAQTQIAQATQKVGSFVSGEHPTQGTVRLVTRDGESLIELGEDFTTSEMGPDLVVILHRSDDVIGSTQPPAYPINEGDYVILAPLQQFKGAQSYSIPASVNPTDYRSAAIWCRKFNATFGAAVLQ